MPDNPKRAINPMQGYIMLVLGAFLVISRFTNQDDAWNTVRLAKLVIGIFIMAYGGILVYRYYTSKKYDD